MRLSFIAALLCAFGVPLPAAWQLAGPFGGSATALAIDPADPATLLAGGRGAALFKSTDGGARWHPLPLPARFAGAVTTLWIDPRDPRHYLAGAHDTGSPFAGLYESLDAGASWTATPDLRGIPVWALASHPADPRRLAAATWRGVWLSDDSGRAWRRITREDDAELRAVTAVAFDPRHRDTLYVGTTHLPWKTTDLGRTWRSIHQGLIDDSDVFSIFIHPGRPDTVLASACSGIYRSLDAGATWRKFTGISGTLRRTHVIRQDPSDPRILYAGTTLGLLRSTDDGATWRLLHPHPVNALALDASRPGRLYLATEASGILRSDDRGTTLQPLNAGFVARRVTALTQSGARMLAATGSLLHWLEQDVPPAVPLGGQTVTALAGDGQLLLAAGASAAARSADHGRTWTPLTVTSRKALLWHDLKHVRTRTGPVWLAATSEGLRRSADGGRTWTETPLGRHRGVAVYALTGDPSGRVLAARGAAGIFISADHGLHWMALDAPFDYTQVFDVTLTASTGDPIFCATTAGLYQYYAGAWKRMAGPLGDGTVSAVRYHPERRGELYAAQFGRVFRSTDAGQSWTALAALPVPHLTLRALWFSSSAPFTLFAVTSDLGVLIESRPANHEQY